MISDLGKILDDIVSSIHTKRRLIYIVHPDYNRVDKILDNVLDKIGFKKFKLEEFNYANGLVDFKNKRPIGLPISDLGGYLDYVNKNCIQNKIIVLKDIHSEMHNPRIYSLLKKFATQEIVEEKTGIQYLIIVSNRMEIPSELEIYINLIFVPLPDETELKSIVKDQIKKINVERKVTKLGINDKDISRLALLLKGMTEHEASQILKTAYSKTGTLSLTGSNQKDVSDIISDEKNKKVRKTGLIEAISSNETRESVGGHESLMKFLHNKSIIFKNLQRAKKENVDIPRGVLLTGFPGCGKSLIAKAASNIFEVPLLRFDLGRILGKYVGDSETNLRNSIEVAEAISPCILWIDELEKAFAGVGSGQNGHEVTMRLLGMFLTWMQERKHSIYIIATSNDVSTLPHELIRKGRFDERYFLNLPETKERQKIFEIHFKKRNVEFNDRYYKSFAEKSAGLTGADVESTVKNATEESFLKRLHDESSSTNKLKSVDVLKLINCEKKVMEQNRKQASAMKTRLLKLGFKKSN